MVTHKTTAIMNQTTLRAFMEYLYGNECGIYFNEKYINESFDLPTTEAQALGHYFEYLCTGATPRNSGEAPQPVTTKAGKLTADYERMHAHVENCKMLLTKYDKYGVEISAKLGQYELNGILDVQHTDYNTDIKTTGFLDNKWEQYGWGGEPEDLKNKPAMFQAKYYTLIEYLNTGKIKPFLFLVFSTKNTDWKIIKVQMTTETLQDFKDYVNTLLEQLEYHKAVGFEAKPHYKKCAECPLTCAHRVNTPDIINIDI